MQKYLNKKILANVWKSFIRIKSLYELQDERSYTISEVLMMLITEREHKQFKLPIMDKKPNSY